MSVASPAAVAGLLDEMEAASAPTAPRAGPRETKQKGALLTLKELCDRMRIPTGAYIHLTSRCNLPCMHCYQVRDGTNGGRQVGYGPDMDTATILRLLDDLAAMGGMMVSLTGGEALLRADFDDIVRYARRQGFIVRLFTNGVMVDEALADRIAAAGPHEVHISVYGVTAATHEAVTCAPGSFARTRSAVELLRARGVAVKVKCQLMTVNFHEWRDVRAWAETLGCSYQFDATMTAREDGDPFPTELRVGEAQLRELYADMGREEILRRSKAWYDWLDQPEDERGDFAEKSICGACSTTVAVVADGRVHSCQLMHVDAGSVLEQPLPAIWETSAWFQKVRGITLNALRECKTCPDLPFCERCSAMALHEDGDEQGPSLEHCRQAAARRAVWEEARAAEEAERGPRMNA